MSSIKAQCGNLKGTIRPLKVLKGTISRTIEYIGSVIEPVTITENGTHYAPEEVNGYNPVTVAVPLRYDEGFADGQKECERQFWDIYQTNGNRTNYSCAFRGVGWTDETFKPKYNINAKSNDSIFSESKITDLKKALEDAGVVLDFSKSTNIYQPFSNSSITRVSGINTLNCKNNHTIFMNAKNLMYVDKLILKANGSQIFNNMTFQNCNALTHIMVEGAIGSDINLQWSPLDYESVLSIVHALVDYSDSEYLGVYTLLLSEDTFNNNLTGEQQNEIYNIATEKGWNI